MAIHNAVINTLKKLRFLSADLWPMTLLMIMTPVYNKHYKNNPFISTKKS